MHPELIAVNNNNFNQQIQPTKNTNSDSNNKKCYRNYYDKILLVIIYNHPHYESIPLLREFYEPVFPNIYFCGTTDNNIKSKYNNRTDDNNVIHRHDIVRGIFGYECLASAIRQNHENGGYQGYFYINDDVILNFWNLIKIKFDPTVMRTFTNWQVPLNGTVPQNWYWWVSPFGYDKVQNAVKRIEFLSKKFFQYEKLMNTLRENGHGNLSVYNGRSDIVYIPRSHALKFQELSSIFRREQVFLEIAIPTICRFLALEKDISHLHGHYIPGDVRKNDSRVIDSRHFWVTYLKNPNLLFIHPFKLQHRSENNKELNLLLMKNILIKKSRELACLP